MTSFQLGDIRIALALLTRLPVKAEFDRSAQASWAYPLAGVVIALLASILTGLMLFLGVSEVLAAGIYVATTIVLTGGLHEDGLADTFDGFWGGFDRTRRLEIMKDSVIGSYGVLVLVLSVFARWTGVWLLIGSGSWVLSLIALECLSRAIMPSLMHGIAHARDTGLSHAQGKVPQISAVTALGIGSVFALFTIGWLAIPLAAITIVTGAAVGALAKHKIGGQTGDVLGATQQLSLIAMLCVIA